MTRSGDTFWLLPRPAKAVVSATCAAAAAATASASLADWAPHPAIWLVALLLALCAAGTAFEIFAPGDYALQPNYVAFTWGALVLPPWAILLLAFACFGPEWALGRALGHRTLFNIAVYALTGLAMHAFAAAGDVWEPGLDVRAAAAVLAGVSAGAVLNHLLVVVVVSAAGERSRRAMVAQLTDGLPLSVGVGLTGAILAVLQEVSLAATLVALGPVALTWRALAVPMLQLQADTDAKTGLYHSERFREELTAQLETAARRDDGRLAVAMVDLDHLRAINTRAGHLAGDRAIRAVADELARVASRHGAAGRFGGEEFAIVLPGFDAERARDVLDDVRLRLRDVAFREGEPGEDELRVTFSAGVAVFPDHGTGVDELLRIADEALYEAKAAGRDRVRIAVAPGSREALEVLAPEAPALVAAVPQPLPATSSTAGRAVTAATRIIPRRGEGDRRPLFTARRELTDARQLLSRMQRSHLQTILTFARALEDKDPYRAGSTDRVAAIAVGLAAELGFGGPELRGIELGAALRDIGTAAVRESTLLKGGRLDAPERDEVRRHADFASEALADLELPGIVKQMVRSHHERWDGSGYPDGLAGEDIPLAARILAVADALDAMLSPRPWRPPIGALTAHAEIAAAAGRQFCPQVAAALARIAGDPGFTATIAGGGASTAAAGGDQGSALSPGTPRGTLGA